MADINVVPKKKSPLPWILLALLLVAIVAYLLYRTGDNATEGAVTTGADTAAVYDTATTPAP